MLPFDLDPTVLATEALFLDIAQDSDASLREAVMVINQRRRVLRAYEAAVIPNREEELSELKACWAARDISRLKVLILQYYRRRQELAPMMVKLMNRSGITQ